MRLRKGREKTASPISTHLKITNSKHTVVSSFVISSTPSQGGPGTSWGRVPVRTFGFELLRNFEQY